MKKRLLSLLLACCAWLPLLAQNISTAIDAVGNPVPIGGISSDWTISTSPCLPLTAALRCPTYAPFWQPTSIPVTNAGWVNCSGTIFNNPAGIYVFERPFSVPTSTTSFSTNFAVAWDDVLISVELVDPLGTGITPLTVIPTAPYWLSQPVIHTEFAPMAGTWMIRATVQFIDNVGAFMLSGNIIQSCSPPLPASLSAGLLAYYPFTGGSLADLSGNAYHLTNPTLVPIPTTDRFGSANCAYEFFGGASDYLTTNLFPVGILSSAASPWSVSLWYKPRTVPGGAYQLLFGRITSPSLVCPDGMSEISVGLYDCLKPVARMDQYSCWDLSVSSSIPSCAGQIAQYVANGWQHLAVTYDPGQPLGSRLILYRNGIVLNNQPGPCGPNYADFGDLFLGLGYLGSLDDVMFYNTTLSVAQITTIRRLGSTCCINRPRSVPPTNRQAAGDLQVYPNPNGGTFSLQLPEGIADGAAVVEIYDWRGKPVHKAKLDLRLDAQHPEIDLLDAPNGIYLIKLTTGGESYYSRFTKE